ncbi:urea carboxylase [Dietzia sp. NCCP-2495]|uniref:urea carboxylase n=1 Tax=Dietzia sp. NCCP-2495 TaxID=2934675 RepID=UPI00222EDEF7|nr:urea carboxylase [Dietzia sp. NCCP-2495]GLB64586.1 urea carboxylase [Dietzia sp. NCCP-2495]
MTTTPTLRTVLVANRGEIAVRIIRTLRSMGLESVAVFSDADRGALHATAADRAVRLGPAPADQSYLDTDAVIAAARESGADAIHPGYGFLSESTEFAAACEAAGIAFIGPTVDQLSVFGTKHTARAAAEAADVPLLAGTGVLDSVEDALAAADAIGYPVMLKATAGGGGIGMAACRGPEDLRDGWDGVRRVAGANFASAGVFLERLVDHARHVEVQVFGDGEGRVMVLGDRDCTLQRRHQKVVEEAPAPALPDAVRTRMHEAARTLCASVDYRSAGTVEFIYDPARQSVSFLEVNTRLQVEHPVTEAVYGIDLVGWMVRLAGGDTAMFDTEPAPRGAAVEARVYAENTDLDNRPSAGTVTGLTVPEGVRVDSWIEIGTEVSAHYDPLLAKLIAYGETRDEAWATLRQALAEARIHGPATNLGVLRAVVDLDSVAAAEHSTRTLEDVRSVDRRLEVLRSGLMTTIQDHPGRVGYWPVGIPPSGPMDELSFLLGNRALGNAERAAGLEITMAGPALRFHSDTRAILTGAPVDATVNGVPVARWEVLELRAGDELDLGAVERGTRSYLLLEGGLDVPLVMGSASTFVQGAIGGSTGRAVATGDVVPINAPAAGQFVRDVPPHERPRFGSEWEIGVLEGPHAAPEFFTVGDMEEFYAARWEVHINSDRTGVRLIGPKPQWARRDGGEAGMHPSNIHDTPYSVGAVDYTGDMPILLGPDGPSLGGFTCPATIADGQKWKLGQLRAGDTVRFVPITQVQADALRADPTAEVTAGRAPVVDGGIIARVPATEGRPEMTLRRCGDSNVLAEYGEMSLDIGSRMRVEVLRRSLQDLVDAGRLEGVLEMTPGIRSLQVHLDPATLRCDEACEVLIAADAELPSSHDLKVPSRTVYLPMSWDDPSTHEAIRRYEKGVRDDAPWSPWNIEFIRRVNGLDSTDDVRSVLFDAEYLVLGLGDVYLGAPVATPVDPRHRLVTTKYNPARTWTPQNAVGIGGSYLCIYGMEGPGGYQFVGRTTQVWSTHRQRGPYAPGTPWLLRFFDRIRWFPVSSAELAEMRADMEVGLLPIRIEDGEFSMAEYQRFLADHREGIDDFKRRQQNAFDAERQRWEDSGEFTRAAELAETVRVEESAVEIPEGAHAVESPFSAIVFRVDVEVGQTVDEGQSLLAVEAMKMESQVRAPAAGVVERVVAEPGSQVAPGSVLVVLRPVVDDVLGAASGTLTSSAV